MSKHTKIETCRYATDWHGDWWCWQLNGRKDIPGWLQVNGGIVIQKSDCTRCPTYKPREKADE